MSASGSGLLGEDGPNPRALALTSIPRAEQELQQGFGGIGGIHTVLATGVHVLCRHLRTCWFIGRIIPGSVATLRL